MASNCWNSEQSRIPWQRKPWHVGMETKGQKECVNEKRYLAISITPDEWFITNSWTHVTLNTWNLWQSPHCKSHHGQNRRFHDSGHVSTVIASLSHYMVTVAVTFTVTALACLLQRNLRHASRFRYGHTVLVSVILPVSLVFDLFVAGCLLLPWDIWKLWSHIWFMHSD